MIPNINMTVEEADKLIEVNSQLETRMQNGEFDQTPLEHCCRVARMVANSKITSRWWERVLAYHLGWTTDPTTDDGKDYGDLFAVDNGKSVIGQDNIELKTCEKLGNNKVGGQQMRFYEDIPWYMFVKLNPSNNTGFRIFVLHKNDIHNEIFEYQSTLPGVSQGSGKTKNKTPDQRRQMIQETFDKKNDILWGFGTDMKSKAQKEVWARWESKYEVTVDQLKDWHKFKETRTNV